MKRSKIPTIDIKKYGGKQVAILNGQIVAVGDTLGELLKQVKKVAPEKPLNEIRIFSVPKSLSVIYYV